MEVPKVTEDITLSALFGVDERMAKLEADVAKVGEAGALNSQAGLIVCEDLRNLRIALRLFGSAMEVQNERIRRLEQQA
jgi:hypothetical protein